MKTRLHSRPAAFSLVEIALALGIIGFCLISLIGLMPVGLTTNQNSLDETAASTIATMVMSDLSSENEKTDSRLTPGFGFKIPRAGESASSEPQTLYFAENRKITDKNVGAAPTENSRYRVSLRFDPPGTNSRYATGVRLLVTWPALADREPTKWPTNFAGSFETVTYLNRN